MATLPIVEQIAEAILARLRKVKTDNGYDVTVRAVRPKKLNDIEAEDKLVWLGQGVPDEPEAFMGNPVRLQWRQPFWIGMYVVPSDKDVTPLDTQLNILRSSIEKGLTTPETAVDWGKWGALAVKSEFGAPDSLTPDDGRYVGLALQVIVTYRTAINNPYTAAA